MTTSSMSSMLSLLGVDEKDLITHTDYDSYASGPACACIAAPRPAPPHGPHSSFLGEGAITERRRRVMQGRGHYACQGAEVNDDIVHAVAPARGGLVDHSVEGP
jgi:hypothetical protein